MTGTCFDKLIGERHALYHGDCAGAPRPARLPRSVYPCRAGRSATGVRLQPAEARTSALRRRRRLLCPVRLPLFELLRVTIPPVGSRSCTARIASSTASATRCAPPSRSATADDGDSRHRLVVLTEAASPLPPTRCAKTTRRITCRTAVRGRRPLWRRDARVSAVVRRPHAE